MKLKELLGSYNSIERALVTPHRVKKLSIRFPEDINVYADEFLRFKNLIELSIHTQLKHPPYMPGQITSLTICGN